LHQTDQAVDQIIDVAERSGLAPFAIDSDDGPMVLRFTVQPSGKVEDAVILVDRVARGDQIPIDAGQIADTLRAQAIDLNFPQAPASSEVTLPIIIGGKLPWMR
jgi:hypothetical protein